MTPDVVCVGILVADAIARPVEHLPERGTLGIVEEISLRGGGCALNTAAGLTRLGLRAAVVGKVGRDPLGDFLLGLLRERDIEAGAVLRDAGAPTSASVALVDSQGERTFLHLPGANGTLRPEELDRSVLFSGRALHLAGALVLPALDGEPSAALLADARARGILTSMDTVFDPSGRWERVVPSLPHVDLFTPGLAEARGITGEETAERAAARLREWGVREVVVTLGAGGCYAASDDFEGLLPPAPVAALDATGAGDAFAAGLLYGRLAGWALEPSARFANAVGALATTATGAGEGLPTADQARALAGMGTA